MISDAATKPKKRWTPKKPAEGESLPSLFASAITSSSSKPRHYVKKAPLPRPDVAPTSDTSTTTNVNMNTIRSSTIPSNANANAKAKTSSTGNSGATATATPGLPSLFAASANTKHKKWTPPKRNITAKRELTTITAASSSSNVKEKEQVQQGPPPPSLSPPILAVPPIEEAQEGLVSPVPKEKAPTPAPAPPRPPKEVTKASQRAAALPTTPKLTLEKRKTKKTEDPPPPMASIDVILQDSHGSSNNNEAWNHTNFDSTTITNTNANANASANTHANCTNISPLTIARPSSLLDRPLTTDAAEVLQILRSAELDNVSISTAGTSRNNSMEEKVQDFLADHPEAVAFVEQLGGGGGGGDAHDKKDEEDDSVSISSVEVSSVEDSSDEGED